jgi:hypothetical protein
MEILAACSNVVGRCRAGAVVLAVITALSGGSPALAAGSFTDADYWAYADEMMGTVDDWWNPQEGVYASGDASVRANSALLYLHSVAALMGHDGASRQDARARSLVDRLTLPPAWLGAELVAERGWSTCWSDNLRYARRQHMSLEPKVAEALAMAWRARASLGLSAEAAARISELVVACAAGPGWRYPRGVLNQMSWNADMYAAAIAVTDRPPRFVRAYRRYLAEFAAHITRPKRPWRAANLGRGYQFHYMPTRSERAAINLDAPEYANITVHAVVHYERALALGMRPLGAAAMRRMRAWVTRLLAGSWTHAGYLNWDTGKGSRRWHSGQYWAFALQGLVAIAASPRFWAQRRHGGWAKAILDRSLGLYARHVRGAGGQVPQRMFDVPSAMESRDVFGARMLAIAARAVAYGLGAAPGIDPPPLYAFDYDTGRLAISTPRYSTAIVPDNRGAFAYGGIEPARLFGPGQSVAAHLGGVPPAAFGVVVSDPSGREVLASQRTRAGSLRLLKAPRGTRPRAYPRVPYAGAFRVLVARGKVRRRGWRVRSVHRFTGAAIESRWRVRGPRRARGHSVRVLFPTWGEGSAIDVIGANGRRTRIAGPGAMTARVPLSRVAAVQLGSGYRLVPLSRRRGAMLSAVPVAPQATNPHPGPSLAVQVPRQRGWASLAVRITPTG